MTIYASSKHFVFYFVNVTNLLLSSYMLWRTNIDGKLCYAYCICSIRSQKDVIYDVTDHPCWLLIRWNASYAGICLFVLSFSSSFYKLLSHFLSCHIYMSYCEFVIPTDALCLLLSSLLMVCRPWVLFWCSVVVIAVAMVFTHQVGRAHVEYLFPAAP